MAAESMHADVRERLPELTPMPHDAHRLENLLRADVHGECVAVGDDVFALVEYPHA